MSYETASVKLLYDNHLDGLLTAIFEAYRLRLTHFELAPLDPDNTYLFQTVLRVSTNKAKANRLKISIRKKLNISSISTLNSLFNLHPNRERAILRLCHALH